MSPVSSWTRTSPRRFLISYIPVQYITSTSPGQHVPNIIRTLAESARSNYTEDEHGHGQRSKIIIHGTIPSQGRGIQIGQFSELRRTYSQEDLIAFGALIGDHNPVHFPAVNVTKYYGSDDNIVRRCDDNGDQNIHQESRPILHGILLSSLFSTIFGTIIPGCIYRSQTLKFYHPVHVDELVCGRVVVTKLRQISRNGGRGVLCSCDTTVTKSDLYSNNLAKTGESQITACVAGEAQVWLPGVTLTPVENRSKGQDKVLAQMTK